MFDLIIKCRFADKIIEHGIIFGDSTILLIKVGQDGSLSGYRDKYIRIAETINRKYGATVICVSNPFDGKNPLDVTMDLVDALSEENGWKDIKIFYMGMSNGGLIGAWYGYLYPEIVKMLLVNMPIQVKNYTYTIARLRKSEADNIVLVYGELDHSCVYLPLIDELISDGCVDLKIIPGEDHNFTFNMNEFMSLPEIYLFSI